MSHFFDSHRLMCIHMFPKKIAGYRRAQNTFGETGLPVVGGFFGVNLHRAAIPD